MAAAPISTGVRGAAVPQTSTQPYYFQEGATLAEMDHGYYAGVSAWYFSLVLASSPYATGYEFNGRSNTGDWYQVLVGDNWPGCSAGFEMLYSDWNAAGSSLGTYCDPGVGTMLAGDTVTLEIYVDTASPYQVCMEVIDASATPGSSTDCVNQPDPGPTPQNNYMEMMSTPADSNGYFTGPMTEVVDQTAASCLSYTSLPAITYQWGVGTHITEYFPWSDEFQSGGSTCYINDGPLQILSPGDNSVHYYQSTGTYGYGPHWEAVTNISSVNANYWWQVCTDCTPASPIVPAITGPIGGDVGQALVYTPSASGGTPSGYYWYLGSVYQAVTAGTWTWTPAAAGTYKIFALAYDASGNRYGPSNTITVTVSAALSMGNPIASPVSGGIDVGQTVTYTSATPTGGVTPYTYAWSGLPTGCSSSGAATDSCVPTGSGTFTVKVTVTDANSNVVSGTLSYVVDSDATISTPTASPASVDVGQLTTFSTTAAAGSGGYSYSWAGLPTGCATANTASLACTPTGAGTFTVTAKVKDSNGFSVTSGALPFTVDTDPTVTIPSATPGSVDLSQGTTFAVTVSGGSGGPTYLWSGLPTGCTGSSTASLACTPTGTGTFSVTVKVTDSHGYSVTSGALSFTVYADPTISTPTAAPPSVDLTQSTTFSTTSAGGSGGFTYTWSGLPTGCSSSSTNALACTPTGTGTFSVKVTVTDSDSYSVTSGSLTFIVYVDITVTTPTATPPAVDLTQSTTFSTTASGGSGGLAYAWSGLPTGCSTVSTNALACTPTGTGTFSVTVKVTDTNSYSVTSAALSFTVSTDPTATTPTGSPASGAIDVGQTVTFTSTTSGGSGGNSYSWSGLPTGCTSSSILSLSCTPTGSGTFSVTVTVTDSNSFAVTSAPLSYVVDSDPAATVPTATPASIDLTQSTTFSTTVSGGSGGYGYLWSGLPTGCSSASAPSLSCTPTAAGAFLVTVQVKDSNGYSVTSGALSFTVDTDPTVTTPIATPGSIDLTQGTTFSVTVSGGSGGTTYLWSGLPTGCASSSTGSLACAPTGAGTFSVLVKVTDSNGYSVSSGPLSFTIYVDPTVTTPTAVPPSVDLTQSTTFSATPSGGSGGYTYTWSGLPTGCTSSSTGVLACTPTGAGTTSVKVQVKDSNGYSVTSGTLSFITYTDTTVAAPTASPTSVDLTQSTTFTATPTGGSGGFSFIWYGLPTGCTSSSTGSLACAPTGAGTFSVTVKVTDSNSYSITSAALSFTVYVDPTVTTPTASPPSVDVGQPTTFLATASGGSGGNTFFWSGLPTGCTSTGTASLACSPTAAGGFSVTVQVTDSNGFSVKSAALPFTVYVDPTVTTPTATPVSVDVGQTTTFSVSASGGSSGYTYLWSGLPAGCSTSSTASLSCSPTAPGTASVGVQVTDSNGFPVTSGTLAFTTYADPALSTPVAAPPSVDLGQTTGISVTLSGGSGSPSYVWSGLPTGCSTASTNSLACTPTGTGTFSVTVQVTDSNGRSTTSAALALDVYSDPSITTPTGTPGSGGIDNGQTVTFGSTSTVGSGGDVYVWSGLPTGCTTSSTLSLACTPSGITSNQTFTVKVQVTDSNGWSVLSGGLAYLVEADPAASTPVATPTGIDSGQSVTFSTLPSLGRAGYTYAWTGLPGGCFTSNARSLLCTPNAVASNTTSHVVVAVTDANGETVTTTALTFVLAPTISVSTPMATPTVIDSGQSTTFSVSASGGAGSYTFSWTSLPTGCTSSDLRTLACTPSAVAVNTTFAIIVSVTDAHALSVVSATLVFVENALPIVSPSADPNPTGTGANTAFTPGFTGGTSPYTYAWRFGDGSTTASGYPDPTHQFNATGTFVVRVWVNDSVGESATGTVSITVSTLAASAGVNYDPTDVGVAVTFTGSASGGVAPYTYAWRFDDGTSATSSYSSPTHVFNVSGTYIVHLWVNDSSLADSQYTVTEVIHADPAVSPSATPSPTDAGIAVTLSPGGTGGTSPSYAWACTDGFRSPSPSPSHAFASAGAPICRTWENDTWFQRTGTVTITVNTDPTITSILGTPDPTDVGVGVALSVVGSGGSSPFSYAWRCADGFSASVQNPSHAFASSGSWSCIAWYNDSVSGTSAPLTLTIDPAPSLSPAVAGPDPVDATVAVALSTTGTGGTAPTSYAWSCTDGWSAAVQNPSHAFATSGVYRCDVWYNDTFLSASRWVTVTVNPVPSIASVSATPNPVDAGVLVAFSLSATGGTSPTFDNWTCPDGFRSTSPSPGHAFLLTGTQVCSVWYNDSMLSSYAKVSVVINADPSLTISAGPNPTDVGVSVALTATTSGGTSPTRNAWACTDGFRALVQSPSHVFGSPGTYTCYAWYNDTWYQPSQSLVVTVNSAPSLGAISATPDPTDVGILVGLSVTGSGGTGATGYAWHCTDGFTSTLQAPSHAFAAAGPMVCWAWFNDSLSSASASVAITVNALPTLSLSTATPGLDVGDVLTVRGTASGGTGALSCRWYVGGLLQSGSSCTSISYTTSIVGTLTVNATVTDSLSGTGSSSVLSVVVSNLPTATESPGSSSVDVGQAITLSATVNGGTAPFACQWYLNGTAVPGATSCSSYRFTPTGVGTDAIEFQVTDSGVPAAQATANSTVVVVPPLTVSVSPGSATLDPGMSQPFAASALGGQGSYVYQWYVNGSAVSGATSTTYAFVPAGAGSYRVGVTVIDAAHNTVWSNVTVTVYPSPSVALTPTSPGEVAVGASLTLTAVPFGGAPPGTLAWYVNGVLRTGASGTTFVFSSPSTGTFQVNVTFVDALSHLSRSNTVSLRVVQMSIALQGPSIGETGTVSLFSATPSGGSAPYLYQWSVDGSAVSGATSSTFSYTPTTAGPHTVSVQVSDAGGLSVSASSSVQVAPSVGATLVGDLSVADVGGSVTFTVSEAGGVGPFSYVWTWTRNGAVWSGPTVNGTSLIFTPAQAGDYQVKVVVTDGLGASASSAPVGLSVNALPQLSLSSNTSSAKVGWTVRLVATLTGGTGPFTFVWKLNGTVIPGVHGAFYNATFHGSGNYSFQVSVTDALGASASSSATTVQVSALLASTTGSPGGTRSSGSDLTGILLGLMLIIVLGLVMVVLFFRRRRYKEGRAPKGGEGEDRPARGEGSSKASAATPKEEVAPVTVGEGPQPREGPQEGSGPAPEGPLPSSGEGSPATGPAAGEASSGGAPASSIGEAAVGIGIGIGVAAGAAVAGSSAGESSSSPQVQVQDTEVSPSSSLPPPPETPVGVIPAGTPPEMLEAAITGEPGHLPVEGEELPLCPNCGSPLPTARTECYVCAAHDVDGKGAPSEPSGVPAPPAPAATPVEAAPTERPAQAVSVAPAAPAPPVQPSGPSGPAVPPAAPSDGGGGTSSLEGTLAALSTPITVSTPAPPTSPPPAPAPPSEPGPGPVATTAKAPASHEGKPTRTTGSGTPVPTSPGSSTTHCLVCGSGLDRFGTCRTCGLQWAGGSG